MFIVIVFGVLLIIGVAYVYKKVKAFKATLKENKDCLQEMDEEAW